MGPMVHTHRHNSSGFYWAGPCCSIMFGYGVNWLFNLLLFPTYLPQAYSPLGRCGCVGGEHDLFWERLVIILVGGPSWQSKTVWRVLCNSTGLDELWGPSKLLIPYSCRNINFFPDWVGRALGTCRRYSAVLAKLWGVWYHSTCYAKWQTFLSVTVWM